VSDTSLLTAPPRAAGDSAPPSEIVVLKFGSSVIPSDLALPNVAHDIRKWTDAGYRVIAVVSAIGGGTDALLAHARQFAAAGKPGSDHALAAYVATGESQAVALLGLSLSSAGVDATILDPGAIGLRTEGPPLDARPVSLDARAVRAALDRAPVLVVPGFIGRDEVGRATLLGRGGSDLSALFIAHHLGARCRLVKDVDGLYDRDPAEAADQARRFDRVRWDDVLALSEGIVQHKGVRFARDHGLTFEVGHATTSTVTIVGRETTTFDHPRAALTHG
jgi:homoserine dehydrogenase